MSIEFTPTPHKDTTSWINDYFAQIARVFRDRFVPGYGGIEQLNSVSINAINSTPQIVSSEFAATGFPQFVTQDLVNDALVFHKLGIWDATFSVAVEFTGTNQARDMIMQLYDVGNGIALADIKVHVGRNQEGAISNFMFLLNIDSARLNSAFSIRLLSTADSFADVVLDTYAFNGVFIDQTRKS